SPFLLILLLFFVLFLSMLPLPPISTLFPYTTLFRSHLTAFWICFIISLLCLRPVCLALLFNNQTTDKCGHLADHVYRLALILSGDRKSTRLNSSHVSISYAVFCLQKNNISRLITVMF